jgi:hypothetical protein
MFDAISAARCMGQMTTCAFWVAIPMTVEADSVKVVDQGDGAASGHVRFPVVGLRLASLNLTSQMCDDSASEISQTCEYFFLRYDGAA